MCFAFQSGGMAKGMHPAKMSSCDAVVYTNPGHSSSQSPLTSDSVLLWCGYERLHLCLRGLENQGCSRFDGSIIDKHVSKGTWLNLTMQRPAFPVSTYYGL